MYWKPIYTILEGTLEIVVANAQHIKKVPGRKSDLKDGEWIADLLCHRLLRSSFVPPKPIRELRDLMRYRRKLVESQAAKVLETANIKLANADRDVFGMSGQLMLRALIGRRSHKKWPSWPRGFYARRLPNWSWLWKANWSNTIVFCLGFSCNDSKRRKKTWLS